MTIKFMINVELISGEDWDDEGQPDFIYVSIDKDLFEKIKRTRLYILDNDIYLAQISIPSPDYYYEDNETKERKPIEFKIYSNAFIIKKSDCFIKGILGDEYLESESFDVIYLEELFRIKELPIEHMGMYLNDEDENIRNIAMERLRGE